MPPLTAADTALVFLGTPFVHCGRVPPGKDTPGGLDCIGLVAAACEAAGARDKNGRAVTLADTPCIYSRRPDGYKLQTALEQAFDGYPPENIEHGDIGLFRLYRLPQHVGILGVAPESGNVTLMHAYQSAGKTARHRLEECWRKRLIGVYRPAYTPLSGGHGGEPRILGEITPRVLTDCSRRLL